MTRGDLCAALASTGLPFAAETWWPEEPPPLPYVLLRRAGTTEYWGDGVPYFRQTEYHAELYSHGRDEASEGALRAAMERAGVPFSLLACGPADETDVYLATFFATVAGD